MTDNTTDATRPDVIEHDATNTTDETMVLSVADAAELLDVSTGAIRKRIERGQLHGRKIAGQWRVVLAKAEVDANATGQDRIGLVASDQAQQMAALVASIQAPLLDRIEAATTRAVIAEQERDDLRHRLAEAELQRSEPESSQAAQDGSGAMGAESLNNASSGVPDGPHGGFARWWAQIFGR